MNKKQIDLSPITLDEFKYKDKILKFNETFSKNPEFEKPEPGENNGLYTFEYREIELDCYSLDKDKLEIAIKEQLEFLWSEYAEEKDENLTNSAKILKNNLLSKITKINR